MEAIKPNNDPYSELDKRRVEATSRADYGELQQIIEEARAYDGWDDTDPRFAHLIEQCQEDIKDAMVYYG